MYFYYGITHSLLENPSEEIELTVDQTYLQPQPKSNKDNHYNYHTQEQTAVWDRHGYENRMAEDSWSTTNNYNANTWDLNDVNRQWDDGSAVAPAPISAPVVPSAPPTRPPPVSSKPDLKPSIPNRSNTQTTQSNQSRSQPQSNQQRQPPANPPKPDGFGSIFVEETQFPTWDD